MSENTVILNNGTQAIVNYNTAKLFLRDTRFIKATYTNSSGSTKTITAGQLFGRIAATGLVIPLVSSATDGSQYPLGFNAKTQDVLNGASVELSLCVAGELAKELVSLAVGDDFDTDIEDKTLGDRIMSDTLGVLLVAGEELTGYDNQ